MAKERKKNYKKNLIVGLIVLALVGGSFLFFGQGLKKFVLPLVPELSTRGFIKIEVQVEKKDEGGLVSLIGDCYSLTANVESTQLESIENALAKKIGPRPNAHDLMANIFSSLDINVLMVKVVGLKGNAYIGQLIIKQGDIILNLDSRPSDGIAIALRMNAPIYVNETLMKENGEKIC